MCIRRWAEAGLFQRLLHIAAAHRRVQDVAGLRFGLQRRRGRIREFAQAGHEAEHPHRHRRPIQRLGAHLEHVVEGVHEEAAVVLRRFDLGLVGHAHHHVRDRGLFLGGLGRMGAGRLHGPVRLRQVAVELPEIAAGDVPRIDGMSAAGAEEAVVRLVARDRVVQQAEQHRVAQQLLRRLADLGIELLVVGHACQLVACQVAIPEERVLVGVDRLERVQLRLRQAHRR